MVIFIILIFFIIKFLIHQMNSIIKSVINIILIINFVIFILNYYFYKVLLSSLLIIKIFISLIMYHYYFIIQFYIQMYLIYLHALLSLYYKSRKDSHMIYKILLLLIYLDIDQYLPSILSVLMNSQMNEYIDHFYILKNQIFLIFKSLVT